VQFILAKHRTQELSQLAWAFSILGLKQADPALQPDDVAGYSRAFDKKPFEVGACTFSQSG
jgi:hypothetical protein